MIRARLKLYLGVAVRLRRLDPAERWRASARSKIEASGGVALACQTDKERMLLPRCQPLQGRRLIALPELFLRRAGRGQCPGGCRGPGSTQTPFNGVGLPACPPLRHANTCLGRSTLSRRYLGIPSRSQRAPRLSTFASLTYCGVGLSRIPVIVVLRWQSTIIGAGYTLPGTGTRPDKRVAFDCVYISSGLRCA